MRRGGPRPARVLIGGSFPAEPRAGAHVPSTLQGLDKCSTSAAIGRGGNERYTLATAKRTRVAAAPSRFPRWRFRHYVRLRRGWQDIGISRSTRHDSLESSITAAIHHFSPAPCGGVKIATTPLRRNSHLFNTHQYQLADTSCNVAQGVSPQLAVRCPFSTYLRFSHSSCAGRPFVSLILRQSASLVAPRPVRDGVPMA